jgi:hypothetical protein
LKYLEVIALLTVDSLMGANLKLSYGLLATRLSKRCASEADWATILSDLPALAGMPALAGVLGRHSWVDVIVKDILRLGFATS